ncbi:putative Protein phosphatase inhibitor 2 (IPP 2) [Trypanosoma vivax]|uniref:Protein phosphatase inhibitor 2 n=1 Tax=Trypanosoma vivax (strain Y486) TaxID=1055687 RepID=G0TTN5_TRYVY|nr:hypothetical protein TRVL_00097 [Trypanosoma vivax]KAH8607214.1 putative Protein phosphatase inhibitor 2 (IPP 2) [Trypanosoma vivax]CCC47316.1 conserved hypothetical protein [Trypanosoma vivax Y486]
MSHRKRVEWDEQNLKENDDYRRAHPVTMRITEPKTPFEYGRYDEEGNVIEDDDSDGDDARGATWDPAVNELARQAREEFWQNSKGLVAPVSSSGRPMLSLEVVSGEALQKQHEEEFKAMRRVIYADEGAKLKEMLRKGSIDEEDDGAEERE